MPHLIPAIVAAVKASAVLQFAVKLGASLLLSAASRALMPKPDVQTTEIPGRQVSSRQAVAPREIVYGRSLKGGTIVFMHTTDGTQEGAPDNALLHIVIVVAAHRVQKIGNIYFNGELAIPDGSGQGTGRWENWAIASRRTGDPSEGPVQTLLDETGGLWTTDHRLTGCAYVYVRLSFDPDTYPTGVPNITCDVEGKADIYDPRHGTYIYTENAALCLADYMANATYGIGAAVGAEDGIETSTLIAAANICDETVSEVGGGTDRRYRCNGVVSLDQPPKTNIEAMLTAMAGQVVWQAGQWHIYAGAYRTPTLTFTTDDIAGDGIRLQTRVSRQENFNGVRGQFVSPTNDWQPDDFPAYQSATYLAEDGGDEAWDDISLPFTISPAAAQRLAKIHLERQRRQQSVTMSGKMGTWRATTADVVNLTNSRYGFTDKPFEVRGMSLGIQDGALVPSLTLRETSPEVYNHTASEFQIYAAAPKTTLPNAFTIGDPGGLQASESLYQTRDGAGVKTQVDLIWTASPSPFVAQYQVEASLDFGPWKYLGRTDQTFFTALDFASGDWRFRVKAISQLGVSSAYVEISQEIFGTSAAPADPTNLTIQAAGGAAILKWDLHPDLDVRIGGRIAIRHSTAVSPVWSNSVSMDTVAGSQAMAVVPLKPGTYLVRAEDAGGAVSNPATVDATGAQIIAITNITTLTEDTTFTGTKSGVIASGGLLYLDSGSSIDSWADFDAVANVDAEGGILPTGTYDFATSIDLLTVKSVRLRSEIDLTIDSVLSDIDSRTGDIDEWTIFDGADGSEVDVWVEVRTTDDDPGGTPTWGPWGRIDSSEVQCRGIEARAILKSYDSAFNPQVSKLRLTADEAA